MEPPSANANVVKRSAFDQSHGTDTDGTIRLSEFNLDCENARFGTSYQPGNPKVVADAMAFFGESPRDFHFFDVVSGKGRILIGAVEQGFRTVTGVEFVPDLVEIARTNLAKVRATNATVWQGDAAQFSFPAGNLLIVFYNPFSTEIMRKVVKNLERAQYKKLYIVYRVPHCATTLDESGFLTPLGELTGWEGEYGVKLWKAAKTATQAATSNPPVTDSEDYPVIDVNLGFDGACRETCANLMESARGMVKGGFIAEGARSKKQEIIAYLSLKDYDYDGHVAFVRKHGNSNAVREAHKAAEAGFVVRPFSRYMHIPDIYEINTSTPERGGKPMRAPYLQSIEELGGAPTRDIPLTPPSCLIHNRTLFGVFRHVEGYMQGEVVTHRQLVGYLSLTKYGNCAIYTTFIGHHGFLKSHVMKLLHLETVRAMRDPANPQFRDLDYLMYHLYFNANKGLTFWKKQMAFQPAYWVNRGQKVL